MCLAYLSDPQITEVKFDLRHAVQVGFTFICKQTLFIIYIYLDVIYDVWKLFVKRDLFADFPVSHSIVWTWMFPAPTKTQQPLTCGIPLITLASLQEAAGKLSCTRHDSDQQIQLVVRPRNCEQLAQSWPHPKNPWLISGCNACNDVRRDVRVRGTSRFLLVSLWKLGGWQSCSPFVVLEPKWLENEMKHISTASPKRVISVKHYAEGVREGVTKLKE